MQEAVKRGTCAKCPKDKAIDVYYNVEDKVWKLPCPKCKELRVFESAAGIYLALARPNKTCHACSCSKVRLKRYKAYLSESPEGNWQYTCPQCSKVLNFVKVQQALDWADLGQCSQCSFAEWATVSKSDDLSKGKWQVACPSCKEMRYYGTRGSASRSSRGGLLCKACGVSKGKKGRKEKYTDIERHLRNAKNRSESSGRYSFNLEMLDLENIWTGTCKYSGLAISLSPGTNGASLDRINSLEGYTPSNIAWVHKDINRMKLAYSLEYFLEMCKKVGEYNDNA